MKKNKKEKIPYAPDDGRTLYSMEILRKDKKIDPENEIELTKGEKKAIFNAMVRKLIPMLLCIIVGFTLCFLLMYLWLK